MPSRRQQIGDRCRNGHLITEDNAIIRVNRDYRVECKQCSLDGIRKFKTKHPLYDVWKTMHRRCIDPTFKDWSLYGGKNPPIEVCARWAFLDNFVEDMHPRPRGYTLERIDSDGPYSPDNCKWASPKEQANNTSRNNHITIYDTTRTIAEWAELAGIKYNTLFMRIKRGEPLDGDILR
jgi:hypothetical protein